MTEMPDQPVTVPAPRSVDEAKHWLTLESYFGDQPNLACNALDYLSGRAELSPACRRWLETMADDVEVDGWCQRVLDRERLAA